MREFEEQKRLIQTVFSGEIPSPEEKGLVIQRSLVRHRFQEVLSHAFPLWYARVDKEAFESSLYAFMQHGAQSPLIWKTPDAYRKFVHQERLFREMPCSDDLLWFEWIEVALIMGNYQPYVSSDFSYDKEYKVSRSCALRCLHYNVFEKDTMEKEGEYPLLAYYDFEDDGVYFREISEVLMLFLEHLRYQSMADALDAVAEQSESTKAEVMLFFKDTLRELLASRVIEEDVDSRH